jgi:Ca2+-binding RTX toxin-like protein
LTSNVIGGVLNVVATNYSDNVAVNYEVHSGVGYYRVIENGSSTWHKASKVYNGSVNFKGYGGNDTFDLGTSRLRAWAEGGDGNDTLLGHNNHDTLMGGEGNDKVYGYGGTDELMAGGGTNNTVNGGDGSDYLYGGTGNDMIYGETGDDWMYGRGGNDTLFGNAGADKLYGEAGNDIISGGVDGYRDLIQGGTGADQIRRELYWNGSATVNRDAPLDFSSTDGDWYYD